MYLSPKNMKRLLNIYPPYIGAGVKIDFIREDWKALQVSMKLRWYNRNAVGTHFGGSLYSMVDPHLMLLMMNILGKDYLVWDKAASIHYIKPGKGRVTCKITVTDEEISHIKAVTSQGDKYLPEFTLQILDEDSAVVSEIKKTLYIKRKSMT